jgi:hypothetical protein
MRKLRSFLNVRAGKILTLSSLLDIGYWKMMNVRCSHGKRKPASLINTAIEYRYTGDKPIHCTLYLVYLKLHVNYSHIVLESGSNLNECVQKRGHYDPLVWKKYISTFDICLTMLIETNNMDNQLDATIMVY